MSDKSLKYLNDEYKIPIRNFSDKIGAKEEKTIIFPQTIRNSCFRSERKELEQPIIKIRYSKNSNKNNDLTEKLLFPDLFYKRVCKMRLHPSFKNQFNSSTKKSITDKDLPLSNNMCP